MNEDSRRQPRRESEDVDQDEVDAVERGDAEPRSPAEETERAAEREKEAAEG